MPKRNGSNFTAVMKNQKSARQMRTKKSSSQLAGPVKGGLDIVSSVVEEDSDEMNSSMDSSKSMDKNSNASSAVLKLSVGSFSPKKKQNEIA